MGKKKDNPPVVSPKNVLAALQRLPDQVWYVWDLATQSVLEGEEELARFHGWNLEELAKLPGGWLGTVHPDDLPKLEQGNKVVETSMGRKGASATFRVMQGNGRWKRVFLKWTALPEGKGGIGSRLACMVQNVTPGRAEEGVLRQRDHYGLLEAVGDAALVLTPDGAIVDANAPAARLLGYSMRALIGTSMMALLSRDAGLEVEALISGHSNSRRSKLWTGTIRKKGGEELEVEAMTNHLRSGLVYLGLRDVSKRKAREQAARREAEHYQGLFENNTAGVVFIDHQMVITGVNRTFCRLLKTGKKALIGSQFRGVCDSIACQNITQMMRECANTNGGARVIELGLMRKDGDKLTVHASPTFFWDAQGNMDGGVIVISDVTEQRLASEALWEKSQFYEALIRDASVMIVIIDVDGLVLSMNRAAERISGFASREICGQVVWKLFNLDEADARQVHRDMGRLMSGEEEWISTPFRFRRSDGSYCHTESQLSLLRRADGSPHRFVATAVDVSERLKLENELVNVVEAEQTRIGHDLHDGVGQMLTGAASLVEALCASLSGEVKAEAERALEVLRQTVLETRRISHGLSPSAIKHRGLEGGLQLLGEQAAANGKVRVKLELETGCRLSDMVRQTHLYRIAQEAVANAMKHSGCALLRIILRKRGKKGVMEIQDNGAGFDPQEESAREGIGLRVMRHRANLIGIDLKISSALGRGCKVVCEFDCEPG